MLFNYLTIIIIKLIRIKILYFRLLFNCGASYLLFYYTIEYTKMANLI